MGHVDVISIYMQYLSLTSTKCMWKSCGCTPNLPPWHPAYDFCAVKSCQTFLIREKKKVTVNAVQEHQTYFEICSIHDVVDAGKKTSFTKGVLRGLWKLPERLKHKTAFASLQVCDKCCLFCPCSGVVVRANEQFVKQLINSNFIARPSLAPGLDTEFKSHIKDYVVFEWAGIPLHSVLLTSSHILIVMFDWLPTQSKHC